MRPLVHAPCPGSLTESLVPLFSPTHLSLLAVSRHLGASHLLPRLGVLLASCESIPPTLAAHSKGQSHSVGAGKSFGLSPILSQLCQKKQNQRQPMQWRKLWISAVQHTIHGRSILLLSSRCLPLARRNSHHVTSLDVSAFQFPDSER